MDNGRGNELDIRLLGTVEVLRNGESLRPRSLKALALLTVLALSPHLRAGQQTIQDHLWIRTPATAATLRTYAYALRGLIGRNAISVTRSGGYQLHVPRERIDYWRLRDLFEQAKQQGPDQRALSLQSALRGYDGEPLRGLGEVNFKTEIDRIKGLYDDVRLLLLGTQLEQGRHSAALTELERLREDRPSHPKLLLLHMQTLVEVGMVDKAKAAYQKYEDYNQESPDPSAWRLYREIGGGKAAQLVARPQTAQSYSTPHFLPMSRDRIFGRDRELRDLDGALLDVATQARIAVVHGPPAVGKTQLALHWANRARARFSGGTLHADLHGYSDGVEEDPRRILNLFINAFREPSAGSPTEVAENGGSLDGLTATYRAILAKRSVLVVLDNARDAAQVERLLATGPGCATLITSRDRMKSLTADTGAKALSLEPLDPRDSLNLLNSVIGSWPVLNEWDAAQNLVELCGGFPLALHMLAAHILAQRTPRLEQLVEELRRAPSRLVALRQSALGWDLSAVFSLSYRPLTLETAELFRRLGLHPGPTISAASALHLADHGAAELRRRAGKLIDAHLLEERTTGTFAFHDLLGDFARECAIEMPAGERAAAERRLLDYLLYGAYTCDRALGSSRTMPIGTPPAGIEMPHVTDNDQALKWFDAEYLTALAAIETARQRHMHPHTWMLPVTLVTYQWRIGHLADAERILTDALATATETGRPTDRATVALALAGTQRHLGKLQPAIQTAQEAIRLGERDSRSEAAVQQLLGILHEARDDTALAVQAFNRALELHRRYENPRGAGHALNGLANARLEQGDNDAALRFVSEAYELLSGTEDRNGTAAALRKRAEIYSTLGQHQRAFDDYQAAIDRYRAMRYLQNEARTHYFLGKAQQAAGLLDEACRSFLRAEQVFEDAPDRPRDRSLRIKLKAEIERFGLLF
ncbi:tetratricopeptide repeat protein [Micromonospora sp. NBC_01699]|uniref:AfsR/SARP family transcriptional regulator n=1 Tax=Micromonospora sp. NBC_01699 TaxID=2975984 RepID=UPI002E2B7DBA|nr:tetratricopeptide repeat protein [Micromonospora sp. NBC_01699]